MDRTQLATGRRRVGADTVVGHGGCRDSAHDLRPAVSRVHGELDELLSALSLYRLTLGQVDQARLVAALERRIGETNSEEERRELREWFEKVRIDLAPALE